MLNTKPSNPLLEKFQSSTVSHYITPSKRLEIINYMNKSSVPKPVNPLHLTENLIPSMKTSLDMYKDVRNAYLINIKKGLVTTVDLSK